MFSPDLEFFIFFTVTNLSEYRQKKTNIIHFDSVVMGMIRKILIFYN